MSSAKLVVGVTGMAGAGKSIVVKSALQKGYEVFVMGDEIREEAKKRGMAPTPENFGRVMLELRRAHGEAVIANRCIEKIQKTPSKRVVVDGIRSLNEVEEFKKNYLSFSLIAVHSSPDTRFRRLYNRQRSDDSPDWKIFRERDLRELGVGLGNAIAMAEHIIVNEGALWQARNQATTTLERIELQWMK